MHNLYITPYANLVLLEFSPFGVVSLPLRVDLSFASFECRSCGVIRHTQESHSLQILLTKGRFASWRERETHSCQIRLPKGKPRYMRTRFGSTREYHMRGQIPYIRGLGLRHVYINIACKLVLSSAILSSAKYYILGISGRADVLVV